MKSQSCFHICYNQNLHFSASLQHDRNLKICHFSKLKPIKKNISISFMEYKWTFANKIQLIYFNLIILKRITCWYWLIFFWFFFFFNKKRKHLLLFKLWFICPHIWMSPCNDKKSKCASVHTSVCTSVISTQNNFGFLLQKYHNHYTQRLFLSVTWYHY